MCLCTTANDDDDDNDEGSAVKMTVKIPLEKLVGRSRGTDDGWCPPPPANSKKRGFLRLENTKKPQ